MHSPLLSNVPFHSKLAYASSKLCDITDFSDPDFFSTAGNILAADPSRGEHHRKLWEFTQAVRILQAHGLLSEDKAGISVAAGKERVLFYLSKYVGRILATDIYGQGDFQKDEANEDFFHSPQRFSPYPCRPENIRVASMNALALDLPDNLFDFALSFSSIEHFGSLGASAQAIDEMARVVKPGGLVLVATECSLNGKRSYDVFLPHEIIQLTQRSNLELIDGINWEISKKSLEKIVDIRRDNLELLPHMTLKSFGCVFTSIFLAFRKPGTSAFPTNFDAIDRAVSESRAKPPLSEVRRKQSFKARLINYFRALRFRFDDFIS
ncbi:MAG: class I SAM-dependent methyltransferase [Bdellovibrionales bacterium]|nr:class I SAM-dependent methyltransferase [Bdellovibrionales bacterium]